MNYVKWSLVLPICVVGLVCAGLAWFFGTIEEWLANLLPEP